MITFGRSDAGARWLLAIGLFGERRATPWLQAAKSKQEKAAKKPHNLYIFILTQDQ
jgi:hypothetical protein